MVQKTYYKTKDYCKVKFSIHHDSAQSVEILGLNNDWKTPVVMNRKKDGSFSSEVNLSKNTEHEFKYLINGTEWMTESEADAQRSNEFGGNNSVLVL